MLKRNLTTFILLLIVATTNAFTQTLNFPMNLGFENADQSGKPAYWVYKDIENDDDAAFVTDKENTEGLFGIELQNPSNENEADTVGIGILKQSIDALYYRGKRIRLSADIKTKFNTPYGIAFMSLIIRETEENVLFQYHFDDNPITNRLWENFQIETVVPGNANEIIYGFSIKGGGSIYVDNVRIEVIEPEGIVNEPPKMITEQAIKNLTAFAKLYSLVKFYHPSNASEKTPWDKFILNNIKEIENAKDQTELLNIFNRIFKDISPSMVLDSKPIERDALKKPKSALDEKAYYFFHKAGYSPRPAGNYATSIENAFASTKQREGAVMQMIDVSGYRGKKIKISVDINFEKIMPSTRAQMWLRCDREENRVAFMLQSDDSKNIDGEWNTHTLNAELPNDATILRIGMVLVGEGIAYYDNLIIEAEGEELISPNNSFEIKGNKDKISGWQIPESIFIAGYNVELSNEKKSDGEKSLKIYTDIEKAIYVPKPGEVYSDRISDSIYVSMPICLWADSTQTYPISKAPKVFNNIQNGFELKAEDRASRLTIALMAWAKIHHFKIIDFEQEILDNKLAEILRLASTDNGENEFLVTMNKLVEIYDDPQSGIWNNFNNEMFTAGFLWRIFDGKLIIFQVIDPNLDIKNGSEVLEINGLPAMEYIKNTKLRLSKKNGRLSDLKALAMIKTGKYKSEINLKLKDTLGEIYSGKYLKDKHLYRVVENRPYRYQSLEGDVKYVDLTRITNEEFKKILQSLADSDKIIFDIRGNSEMSIHFLGFFNEEPIPGAKWKVNYYTKPFNINNNGRLVEGELKLEPILANKNILFLADERSTGYAETILSTVKSNGLAKIMGYPTEGSYGENIQWLLPGFYIMNVPIIKNMTPEGEVIGSKGIEPDIYTEYELDDFLKDEDTLINKALEMLNNSNN